MLESCQRGALELCIRCVADERAPLAEPVIAGAAAALRALLLEAQLSFDGLLGVDDRCRLNALTDAAYAVSWLLTPPNLRTPGIGDLDETHVLGQLDHYDKNWGLRTSTRSLVRTYRWWKASQVRATRVAKLADIDREYAEFIVTERGE